MTARTIETKAIISAEDKTGGAFAAVVQKLAKMEAAAKATRIQVGADARQARAAQRVEMAHERERLRVRREVEHHGVRRYVAQTAATAVAAHEIVNVIKDTLKAGASYQHEIVALQNAGRNAQEMEQITRAARDAVAQIPTSTYTENLKVINETTSAFGSLNHAIENLPFMQKSAAVLQAASPAGVHVDAGDLGNKMARVFEERGTAGNPELFRKEAAELMRAMVFSGGKFNPTEALNFAQQAKSSLQNYDLRFLTRIAPSLIGTQGGERAGTAANAFASVLMGKARDAKQAAEWMRYGLLDPKLTDVKAGKPIGWRAGAVKGTNLALTDPLRWAEEVALPAMKAKGVNVDDRLELAKVLGTMFRNQNSNFFANEIFQAQQRARLHKDEDLINKAGSLDDIYQRNLAQDPTQAIVALKASLDNLMTAVSAPAMSAAAAGITSVATALQGLANAAKDHPLAAMAGGGALAAGALGGSGYMAYQLANGFGLGASATALDGSAVALDTAAAALDGAAAKLALGGGASAAEHAADRFLAGGARAAEGAEGAGGAALRNAPKAAGVLGLGAGASAAVVAGAGIAFGYGMLKGAQFYKDQRPQEFYGKGGPDAYYRAHPEAVPLGHYEGGTYGRGGWHNRDFVLNNRPVPWHWGTTPISDDVPDKPMLASQPLALSRQHLPRVTPPIAPVGAAPTMTSAPLPTLERAPAPPPQKVDVGVQIEQPPPGKIDVNVTAGSALLAIEQSVKEALVQIKAVVAKVGSRPDTGPGGLGDSGTGQGH